MLNEEDDCEMPTPCKKCEEIFDFNDGYGSEKWFKNTVICENCHELEEAEIERDDEIENLEWEIENALDYIRHAHNRLKEIQEYTSSVFLSLD